MKKKLIFVILILTIITCFASGQTKSSPQILIEDRAKTTLQLNKLVDTYLKNFTQTNDFSGAVLIAKNSKILVNKGYGLANYELNIPNNSQTKLRIGSISKQFTATAILLLEEKGKLSLKDTLFKFIPDFPSADKITIEQLLTHTAGIKRDFYEEAEMLRNYRSIAEIVSRLKTMPLDNAPDTKYSYSNSGYILLAFIIEKASGQSYSKFLKENIFQPLGMQNTDVDDGISLVSNRANGYLTSVGDKLINAPFNNMSNLPGNGSLYSTTEDLFKWSNELSNGKILSAAVREKILKQHLKGYGYGMTFAQRFKHKWVGHDGIVTGFASSFEKYLDDNACIIILSNIETGAIGNIRNTLAAILFNEKYDSPKPREINKSINSAKFEDYVGRYEVFPGFYLDVKKNNDELQLRGTGGEYVALTPINDSRFFYRHKFTFVEFRRDEKGQVTKLDWIDGANQYPCKRLK